MFVALILVLFTQAEDFLQHLNVEAFALGLGQNFLLTFIQCLDLFVDVLDPLDMRSPAIPVVSVMCFLIDEEIWQGAINYREVNRTTPNADEF